MSCRRSPFSQLITLSLFDSEVTLALIVGFQSKSSFISLAKVYRKCAVGPKISGQRKRLYLRHYKGWQRRQSGLKSGGRGSGSKNFDFFRQFTKRSIF